MIIEIAFFSLAVLVAALCLCAGYWLGQRQVHKVQAQLLSNDAHVTLCRNALLEIKEEQGNILNQMMAAEAKTQKTLMRDMDDVKKTMEAAINGGTMPSAVDMASHPPVGSPMRRR